MVRTADGGILVQVAVGPDASIQETTRPMSVLLRSDDDGETWYYVREFYAYTGHLLLALPDGTILAPSYWITYKERSGVFVSPYKKSTDNGRTFTGPHEAPVTFPEAKLPLRDGRGTWVPGRTVAYAGWWIGAHPPVAFPDGRLLGGVDLHIGRDRASVGFMESLDNGESWSLVSSIPPDPEVEGEGFDEAAIALLPSGKIVAILRTGGYKPLYQAESTDDGRTWTKPRRLDALGVAPYVIRLASGVLACSYGRPGCHIMFSLDDGASWTDHTRIFSEVWNPLGTYSHEMRGSMMYTSILEVEPGRILYMYDTLGVVESPFGDVRDRARHRVDSGNLLKPANYIRVVEIDVELVG
jgi:hypothetical protein